MTTRPHSRGQSQQSAANNHSPNTPNGPPLPWLPSGTYLCRLCFLERRSDGISLGGVLREVPSLAPCIRYLCPFRQCARCRSEASELHRNNFLAHRRGEQQTAIQFSGAA